MFQLFKDFHEETGDFLVWLAHRTDFHTAAMFKNGVGDICALLTGGIIAILFVLFVIKDSRLVVKDNVGHIFITRFKKNNRTKIFVTLPPDKGHNLTVIMGIALLFNVALVRLFPIKQIQFVGRYKMYTIFWITVILIFLFCITAISIDYHFIAPDGHGGYKVEY